jgi:hypothetical protein
MSMVVSERARDVTIKFSKRYLGGRAKGLVVPFASLDPAAGYMQIVLSHGKTSGSANALLPQLF